MSDEATIVFLLTCAVLAGIEAMKASGWRVWAFGIIAAAFTLGGFGWHWLKEIYPPATKWISDIATSPQSWFVLFVLVCVLIAVTGRRSARTLATGPLAEAYDDSEIRAQIIELRGKPDDALDLILPEVDALQKKAALLETKIGTISEAAADLNEVRSYINDLQQKMALLTGKIEKTSSRPIRSVSLIEPRFSSLLPRSMKCTGVNLRRHW